MSLVIPRYFTVVPHQRAMFSDMVVLFRAAFFKGQIEHPGNPVFSSINDDPVYIAVNPTGVFIIDLDDVVSYIVTCVCCQHDLISSTCRNF